MISKVRPFEFNVKSVILYGPETWRRIKVLDKRLQVFINTCLSQILHIRWPGDISNQELWQRANQVAIIEKIQKGNGSGMDTSYEEDKTTVYVTGWTHNLPGNEADRPTLDSELRKIQMSWRQAATYWVRWRGLVSALCPSRDKED